MTQTIEIEVGGLYADLHEQFESELGEQYDAEVRAQLEDFLHNFNQQIERQTEAMQEPEQKIVDTDDS